MGGGEGAGVGGSSGVGSGGGVGSFISGSRIHSSSMGSESISSACFLSSSAVSFATLLAISIVFSPRGVPEWRSNENI